MAELASKVHYLFIVSQCLKMSPKGRVCGSSDKGQPSEGRVCSIARKIKTPGSLDIVPVYKGLLNITRIDEKLWYQLIHVPIILCVIGQKTIGISFIKLNNIFEWKQKCFYSQDYVS